MAKPAASIAHERGRAARGGRAILKPVCMPGATVHVAGVTAETLQPRPATAHGRGREARATFGLGTECAWQAGMAKPAASITHERGRAAWGGRTILKPACMAGVPVNVAGVRAEALQLAPTTAHGRGREAWAAVGLDTECARQAGLTKPAASITHEGGRALLFRKVLVPAVHHALTDLLQVGFSLARFRRAGLSVNVGSAEQEAQSRAQRTGRF